MHVARLNIGMTDTIQWENNNMSNFLVANLINYLFTNLLTCLLDLKIDVYYMALEEKWLALRSNCT